MSAINSKKRATFVLFYDEHKRGFLENQRKEKEKSCRAQIPPQHLYFNVSFC